MPRLSKSDKVLYGLSTLIWLGQIGCAVAMLPIIWYNLGNVSIISYTDNSNISSYTITSSCIISSDPNYFTACTYAYFLAGVSICFTIISVCFVCCSVCCVFTPVIAVMFDIIGTTWWLVGSIILQDWINEANDTKLPNEYWRNVLIILSWTLTGLFGAMVIIDFTVCCSRSRTRRKNNTQQPITQGPITSQIAQPYMYSPQQVQIPIPQTTQPPY
jgi:hypothetical protein